MPDLHPSHRWGKRPTLRREEPGSNRLLWVDVPCCLNCLVDGYEDEWDAFQPCRRTTVIPPGQGTPDGDV